MFKKIALGLVVVILVFLGFVASRPGSFRVERSIAVKASPDKIFPLVNDFHQWALWSPWDKLDPTMQRTYSGPSQGQGAAYAWQSAKVGDGRMEIIASAPPSGLVVQLDFIKPFEAHNVAEFTLLPQGDSTKVSWVMRGPNPFMAKLMGLFFSMDQVVGKDFETGLANIKAAAEKP